LIIQKEGDIKLDGVKDFIDEDKYEIIESSYNDLNEEVEIAIVNEDFDKAIKLLQKIIKEKPGDTNALNNLGVILAAYGEIDEAKRAFNLVLKVDPANEIALENLKILN
jgi:Flp pilus assembly protein TadD